MKKTIILFSLILLASALFSTITVDGYAYLENQTDHSGIEVLFERTAPSALTYTVYTNTSGYYSVVIETGIYDISYSKELFFSNYRYDEILYSDTTIPDTELLISIQQHIDASTNGDTIIIPPGTYYENINFNGKNITLASLYNTTQDTSYIYQTIIDGSNSGSVIIFENDEDSTAVISGFTITNGYCSGSPPNGYGGGLFCINSSPTISDLIIHTNSAQNYGGGIAYINSNSPKMENIILSNNSSGYGAGIYLQNSSPDIINVRVVNNTANYQGGGLYSNGSCPNIYFSVFKENLTNGDGGGLYLLSNSSAKLSNVTITNNIANENGGGIYCCGSTPTISNSIISNNMGYFGIFSEYGNIPDITYSDFFNNEYGNFYNCGQWIGVNLTTNANGDSCDAYMNIQLDPCYVDPLDGNFHITDISPCIDAGDPSSPVDPDGTISDIGAYYYDQNQPSADFSANLMSGTIPLIIDFSDISTMGLSGNPIIEWYWDFDSDGTIDSNEQNPQWTYYERGAYTVTLTIFDGTFENTEIKEDFIELLNSQPIVQNQIDDFSFDEDSSDTSIDLNIVFDDPDLQYGDELSFSYSGNTNIQVDLVSSQVTLIPNPDWFGSEAITFTASDDQNEFISDEVTITIDPVNDPPILNIAGTFEADEDLPSQTYDFSVFCSQTFGETDNLTLSADNSTHIYVTITGFDVIFESNTLNWNGTEDITFHLDDNVSDLISRNPNRSNEKNISKISSRQSDNTRDIVNQIIQVTINPVNDAPTIVLPDNFTFEEDNTLVEDFAQYINDVDLDDLTLSVSGNTEVIVDIVGTIVTFCSTENWNGIETLTFVVDDNASRATAEDEVDIIVTPVNDEPVLLGFIPEELTFTIIQDSTVAFSVVVEDIDSDLNYDWFVDDDLQTETISEFIYQFINLGNFEIKSIVSDEEYEIETIWLVEVESGSGINDLLPVTSKLHQNFPNPFNPSTTIKYNLSKTSTIRIELYNIKGQRMISLVNQNQDAGYHSVEWNGKDLSGNPVSSGLYLYKLIVDNKSIDIKKCLLLK
jgi:predicted outer membrane repeat protein